MTLDQFRSHDTYPTEWAQLLRESVILNVVLSVMEENHPARFALVGDNNDDVSPTRAAIELGMTRGYSKYGDTLKLLAKRKLQLLDVGETTYEKEEVPHHG